ncbi:hypothetical protein [Desertibacillus haloalkaliphilus]|uniref:hypothetical protein n=1 Tax=Desertibacillus haloalkaliphilus TaxID=1328930 RepID=UPI001C26A83A|nr:hypothetical protein [Desertibacillus haloalkaliphilus]MBU8907436.1 hypothetical protein [Desertibacillus haloalkaliphilus]
MSTLFSGRSRLENQLYHIKKQMQSNNPEIRELAMQTFAEMVERDVKKEKTIVNPVKKRMKRRKPSTEERNEQKSLNQQETKQEPGSFEQTSDELATAQADRDVMYKIRTLQKEKQSRLQKRKKRWFLL